MFGGTNTQICIFKLKFRKKASRILLKEYLEFQEYREYREFWKYPARSYNLPSTASMEGGTFD